jgi:hypothetical protein
MQISSDMNKHQKNGITANIMAGISRAAGHLNGKAKG